MLELWMDLPPWLRIVVALGLMALGVAIVWISYTEARRIPFAGLGIAATGLVLVLVGGKSNAEKNGYRF